MGRYAIFGWVCLALAASNVALAAGGSEAPSTLRELDARLTRAERLLDNQALVDMYQRLGTLQKEVQVLRGENERLAHELELVKARQRDLYLDIDRRLQGEAALRPPLVASPPRVSVDQGPSGPSASPPVSAPVGAPAVAQPDAGPLAVAPAADGADHKAYRQAFDMLREGRYEQAIDAFARFLKAYPQSPYAANARYWQAEAYYVIGDFPAARAGFEQVIKDYPDSDKAPDAALKLGFSQYELGQWEAARKRLEDVRRRYPDATVARLAADRLQRMGREGH